MMKRFYQQLNHKILQQQMTNRRKQNLQMKNLKLLTIDVHVLEHVPILEDVNHIHPPEVHPLPVLPHRQLPLQHHHRLPHHQHQLRQDALDHANNREIQRNVLTHVPAVVHVPGHVLNGKDHYLAIVPAENGLMIKQKSPPVNAIVAIRQNHVPNHALSLIIVLDHQPRNVIAVVILAVHQGNTHVRHVHTEIEHDPVR